METAIAVAGAGRRRACARSRTAELGERNVVLFDWLERRHARRRRRTTCMPGLPHAGRRLGAACTATRAAWAPPGRLRALLAGTTTTTLGAQRPLGPVAGRSGHGRGRSCDAARAARRHACARGWRPTAGAASGSASCTPTSGSRTCSSTGEHVRVIDFDDCGLSWFMYDFATTVSFIEDHPDVPALTQAWVDGYRSVADARSGRRGRARDVRDAAPAAARRLDRLPPPVRDRGGRARRRLHRRHVRAGRAYLSAHA